MNNPLYDIKKVINDLVLAQDNSDKLWRNFNSLITDLVKLAEKHRLDKDYVISDMIRELLNKNGIEIINGTKQYGGYENIPDSLKNNTSSDRWSFK